MQETDGLRSSEDRSDQWGSNCHGPRAGGHMRVDGERVVLMRCRKLMVVF